MNRKILILIAAAAAVMFAVSVVSLGIFVFGRRPAPEPLPVGEPSPSPAQIFGISLPMGSFFRSRPAGAPSAIVPPASPTITPPPQIPILLPSPAVAAMPLSPSWERKVSELRAQGRTAFTNEELFELRWPTDYREKLSYLQDLAIQQGLIPASARTQFRSQDEIVGFLISALPAAVETGVITRQDADRFATAIATDLVAAKDKESVILQARLLQSVNPQQEKLAEVSPSGFGAMESQLTLLGAATELFKGLFYPKPAVGQFGIDCFQEITYTPNWLGPVFWAPNCNGFAFKIPVGCLNFFCAGRSAIWDSITGICGCDI